MVSQQDDNACRHGVPPPGGRLRRLIECCSIGFVLLCTVWSPYGAAPLGWYGPPPVQVQDRPVASDMKIGTARLNARTRQMTYTPAVSQ